MLGCDTGGSCFELVPSSLANLHATPGQYACSSCRIAACKPSVGDKYTEFDYPGLPRYYRGNSHARRVRSAWGTATDCELLLFIVDAHRQV